MIYDCPECGGRLHAVGVGGSFSGGDVWGLCADCSYKGEFGCSPGWHEGFFAVARLLPLYKNESIIECGKRPRFDWQYGLVGETTPDKVLVAAIEPVDLPSLLDELEAAEAGAVIPDEGAEPVPPRKSNAPTVFLQIQKGQGVLKIPLHRPGIRPSPTPSPGSPVWRRSFRQPENPGGLCATTRDFGKCENHLPKPV
jgi:hypothetical protein